MLRTTAFIASILFVQSANAQHLLWDGLPSGPHNVGYRLIRVTDATRTFPGEAGGRPVEFRIWYPAAPANNAPRMPYARYLEARADSGPQHTATTDELIERTRRLHQFVIQRYGGRDTTGLHARWLNATTGVIANAAPAPGRFPVIVYGAGANQGIEENTVLWEMLASHGYIVAAVPSVGVQTTAISVNSGGLEAEARDMEVALGWLRRFPSADTRMLATMGFSWGGAAALVVAMRQPDTDAVVLLDASTVAPRFHPVIRRSPYYEDANLAVPLLHLHARASGISMALIDDLRYSDREYVEIAGLDHIDFNSYMLLVGALRGASASQDSSLNAKRAAYRSMASHILGFLDIRLNSKPASLATSWAGYPRESVRITRRTSMPVPITADELIALIGTRGIAAGDSAYQEVRRRDPRAPVLTEAAINGIGYALFNNRQPQAAERVFLWNVRAYPSSTNTYDSLADAYIALNKTACAVAAYRKVLEKLPGDAQLDTAARESYARRANEFIAKAGTIGSCADRF